ncbi:MAG: hypothetical protein HRT61_20940 [Ekhidna sp.]|nr:hypothetical protein [Ekhidna sp.]
MKDIYTKEGIVKTYSEGKVIKVIWDVLSNKDALYESCKAQLDVVKEDEIEVIIIDVSNATGTPPMEVQQWFGEVLFPGYKACPSFKGLINILPKSAITKMGANHWKKTAESETFGFTVYESDSMENAEALAKEMMG